MTRARARVIRSARGPPDSIRGSIATGVAPGSRTICGRLRSPGPTRCTSNHSQRSASVHSDAGPWRSASAASSGVAWSCPCAAGKLGIVRERQDSRVMLSGFRLLSTLASAGGESRRLIGDLAELIMAPRKALPVPGLACWDSVEFQHAWTSGAAGRPPLTAGQWPATGPTVASSGRGLPVRMEGHGSLDDSRGAHGRGDPR
jgi:hypothetical protein